MDEERWNDLVARGACYRKRPEFTGEDMLECLFEIRRVREEHDSALATAKEKRRMKEGQEIMLQSLNDCNCQLCQTARQQLHRDWWPEGAWREGGDYTESPREAWARLLREEKRKCKWLKIDQKEMSISLAKAIHNLHSCQLRLRDAENLWKEKEVVSVADQENEMHYIGSLADSLQGRTQEVATLREGIRQAVIELERYMKCNKGHYTERGWLSSIRRQIRKLLGEEDETTDAQSR